MLYASYSIDCANLYCVTEFNEYVSYLLIDAVGLEIPLSDLLLEAKNTTYLFLIG